MSATTMRVNVGARLDRLPASRFHTKLAALIGGGMFFDGFDLFMAASVLGALTKSGFSDVTANGHFITATFLGMTIGSFASGWVGDRFGRRKTYQINLLIYGGGSVLAALAPDINFLIGARFVIGIGLGAEIVVGYATFTEFLPPAVRGKWLGVLAMPMQLAVFLSSFIGLLVIPSLGWRPMFWIAAIGAAIVWYLRKNIPESPRWLEQKGRYEEAEAITRRIEQECGHMTGGADIISANPPAFQKTSVWNKQFLIRFFVCCVAVIMLNVVGFGLSQFLPTFFVKEGFSITKSLTFNAIMNFGGPVGGLLAILTADWLGRKKTLIYSGFCLIVFYAIYPFADSGLMITGVGFLLVTSLYWFSATNMGMFVPESFPTDVRLRSVGSVQTIGRISGAIAPFIVVALYSSHGIMGVIAMMVAILIFNVIVIWTLGIEPRFKSLEALSLTDDNNPATLKSPLEAAM